MVTELKVLNSKEVKELKKIIKNNWDSDVDLDYAFVHSGSERLYVINKEISKIDWQNLRISMMGSSIGTYNEKGFRLNIEGTQLVGPSAKKNVIEINDEQVWDWMKGKDIEIDENLKKQIDEKKIEPHLFVIIKRGNDYLSSGKIKNNLILNHVSKSRKLKLKDTIP